MHAGDNIVLPIPTCLLPRYRFRYFFAIAFPSLGTSRLQLLSPYPIYYSILTHIITYQQLNLSFLYWWVGGPQRGPKQIKDERYKIQKACGNPSGGGSEVRVQGVLERPASEIITYITQRKHVLALIAKLTFRSVRHTFP